LNNTLATQRYNRPRIFFDREEDPVGTVNLVDDGQGVGIFTGQWSGSTQLGWHSIDLVAVDDHDPARTTRRENVMGFPIAHTIFSVPDRMLLSPEQLSPVDETLQPNWEAVKVPVLIEDDGHGIENQAEPGSPGEHIGLHIMQERAAAINGEVTIESEPGEGTRVYLHFPSNPQKII